MPTSSSQTAWITIAFVALIVLRFLFRELRERRVRTRTIFLIPVIIGGLAIWFAYLTATLAPSALPSLPIAVAAALVVGGGLGLAIAHFTTVRTGPPGFIYLRGSWITVAIWVGALLLRMVGRYVVTGSATGMAGRVTAAGSAGGLSPDYWLLNTALFVLLAGAALVVRLRVLAVARTLPPETVTTA
jgi:hypothetical protein